jgi:hypothetical protein
MRLDATGRITTACTGGASRAGDAESRSADTKDCKRATALFKS